MVQTLVKSRMRGTAVVGFLLCQNLFGAGLGPFLIGFLNDVLGPQFGADAVRYSLSMIMLFAVCAGLTGLATNRWLLADHRRTWQPS